MDEWAEVTPIQDLVIEAIVACKTKAEIFEETGVDEGQLDRWLSEDEDFRAALGQRQKDQTVVNLGFLNPGPPEEAC